MTARTTDSRTTVVPCRGRSGDTGSSASPSASTRSLAQALLEPHLVHAVAAAIDVAAKQALVRLHQLGRFSHRAAHRAGQSCGRATDRPMWNGLQTTGSINCRRVLGHCRVYSEMAMPRSSSASSAAFDEALGAPVRRVALADDGESHVQCARRCREQFDERAYAPVHRQRSSGTPKSCRRRNHRCRTAGTGVRPTR